MGDAAQLSDNSTLVALCFHLSCERAFEVHGGAEASVFDGRIVDVPSSASTEEAVEVRVTSALRAGTGFQFPSSRHAATGVLFRPSGSTVA